MKQTALLLSLVLLAASTGCSTMSVQTDFDRDVDFSTYRTYDWIPQRRQVMPMRLFHDSLTEKRIRTAVEEELAAKGFIKATTGKSEFLVAYHVGAKNKIDVDVYGYGYGWRSRWYGRGVHVHRYKRGTLVIDIVDPVEKQLVWRGWATDIVHGPEEATELIEEGVHKILERFPPKIE